MYGVFLIYEIEELMEELFKLMVMSLYLQEQNVKDTTTYERIDILDKEIKKLSRELAEKYLAEKFPPL